MTRKVLSDFDIGASLELSGDISPTQITSTQNDYTPTSLAAASILRCTTDAGFEQITGIGGGVDGRVLVILNVNATLTDELRIAHENTGSIGANRIITPTGGTMRLRGGDGLMLIYDATSSRWRVMGLGIGAGIFATGGTYDLSATTLRLTVAASGAFSLTLPTWANAASTTQAAQGFVPVAFGAGDVRWLAPPGPNLFMADTLR